MNNLGVALAGGGPQSARKENDFYATPEEGTEALLRAVGRYVGHVVHEPACGDGAMARVLEQHGYTVIATDLVDRGYGESGVDFLKHPPRAKSIITNPPFNQAAPFIEHISTFEPEFFALLLKATFWNAAARMPLFERYPPKLALPLTWRLDFLNKGAPTMDCTWFVWGTNVPGGGYRPLAKPRALPIEEMFP